MEHEWLKELLSRDELSLIDICRETGVGRVALVKVLAEGRVKVRLTVFDLSPARGSRSLHVGYDHLRSVEKRLYLNPFASERATLELCYWDLAGILTLAWLFFEDVDFVSYLGRAYTGMSAVKSPQRKLALRI